MQKNMKIVASVIDLCNTCIHSIQTIFLHRKLELSTSQDSPSDISDVSDVSNINTREMRVRLTSLKKIVF